jgi:threonine dehydrogenase-like Zn-dependent dehydrogenase
MKAVTYRGPSRLEVRDKPEPRIEDPGDAILRVTRAAICGSDLHLYHGLVPDTRVGSTFGHEFTGVVEDTGTGVERLRRGDRVVVPFNIACGGCFFCVRGLWSSCERSNPNSELVGGVYGSSHMTGGYEGAQAEFVRVPYADVGPFPIPDDMTDEQVLFLGDILPTGWQAAEMGGIQPGDTVAVFGCGPVGLFAQVSARIMGAGRIIAIDDLPYRLDMARTLADAETLDFEEVDDVVTALRAMTDGRGPDVCIDAVGLEASGSAFHQALGALMLEAGRPTALQWAIDAVRRGGHVSIIGLYGPPWNLVPIGTAMQKGLTLRSGQCNVRTYMDRLLELIRAGRIDPTRIISHRLPLDHAPEAYELFARKQDDCLKCVLLPEGVAS